MSATIFSPIVRSLISKRMLFAELGHNLLLLRKDEIEQFDDDGNDSKASQSDHHYSHDSKH